MKKHNGKLAGILGTVIIHLIAGIVVMVFQIRELHVRQNLILDLELVAEPETAERQAKPPEATVVTVERALQGDEELLNIARNLSAAANPIIDRNDYINMVKDELVSSGQLGADNYIDMQGHASPASDYSIPVNSAPARTEEKPAQMQQAAAASYKGPTRIYYSVEGRTHTYMPVPIYRCQGSGKITLQIEITQSGDVAKAAVLAGESSADECLTETAVNSALVSKFNSDIRAPKVQTGTLTFHFVAQ
ncbi:MAG: hypothetical protein LBV26_00505 [Bacteroidales bacterium]|jgi:hypothetical protein|nr:hypothetical protein [Bacteroidales bacterium]